MPTIDRRAAKSPCRACPSPAFVGRRAHAAPSSRARLSPKPRRRDRRGRTACAGSTSSARAQLDRAWLEEHFDFHPLDYEDVFSRNQRPKVDEYDDYLFIVLHFPRYDKHVGAPERRRARHLRRARLPDHAARTSRCSRSSTCSSAAARNEELREQLFSKGAGYLLYKIVDDCVDASFPMLRKMGNKLERIEEDIFEGRSSEVVRDISNVKQEIINFRKIVRPQRAALRDLERTKRATSPRTSTSTSTTSSTRPSASGTCSRTTRRSSRRSRPRTSR